MSHVSSVSLLSLVVIVVDELTPKPRSLLGWTAIPLLAIERFQSLCIVRVIRLYRGSHLESGKEKSYFVFLEGRSRGRT